MAPLDQVTIRPPLTDWATAKFCGLWAQLITEHGPLIAIQITRGTRWWELDDVARTVANARQDTPADQRDLWLALSGSRYIAIPRRHLEALAAALDRVGGLVRLDVRELPDPFQCTHTRCGRRRAELYRNRP